MTRETCAMNKLPRMGELRSSQETAYLSHPPVVCVSFFIISPFSFYIIIFVSLSNFEFNVDSLISPTHINSFQTQRSRSRLATALFTYQSSFLLVALSSVSGYLFHLTG